jgi:hypothetical protein
MKGIAHYMKLLIRIGIRAAVKKSAIDAFLDSVVKEQQSHQQKMSGVDEIRALAEPIAYTCAFCQKPTEASCFRHLSLTYHPQCVTCPQCHRLDSYVSVDEVFEKCRFCSAPRDPDLQYVDLHKQYVHLLWVALARFVFTCGLDLNEVVDAYNVELKLMKARVTDETPIRMLNDIVISS